MPYTVRNPYMVIRFLGVLVELAIVMISPPISIHPDYSALFASFSLNRLTDLEYPSMIYGSFRMALLNSLVPVVEVYPIGNSALDCPGARVK